MTDYTQGTGQSGTMMIRDNGDWIEFWLKANSSTFNYQLPWAYVVDGNTSSWQEFRFVTGGNWQKIASFYITWSQNVTFKLGRSGTNSLGGPTDFTVWIDRARVPDPPSLGGPYNIWTTYMSFRVTDNWDGGAAIGTHQIGYGTDPWNIQYLSALSADTWITIDGLPSGVTCYFWARSWNAKGWSNWGNRVSGTTYRVPDAPTVPTTSNVTPTSIRVNYAPNWNGGLGIWQYEIAWSWDTADNGAYTSVTTGNPNIADIYGLTPGRVYYFWVRARNDAGWGPYAGPSAAVRTLAGVRINDNGTWRLAVPYINDVGVWRLAEPWINDAGTWRRTG